MFEDKKPSASPAQQPQDVYAGIKTGGLEGAGAGAAPPPVIAAVPQPKKPSPAKKAVAVILILAVILLGGGAAYLVYIIYGSYLKAPLNLNANQNLNQNINAAANINAPAELNVNANLNINAEKELTEEEYYETLRVSSNFYARYQSLLEENPPEQALAMAIDWIKQDAFVEDAAVTAGNGAWIKPRSGVAIVFHLGKMEVDLPQDIDNDGLTLEQEQTLGTDPLKADTDGDGLSDSAEIDIYKTNPIKADSDEDGYDDGTEIKNGYNPNGPGKAGE